MHIDLVGLNITQKSLAKSSHTLNILRIALCVGASNTTSSA